MDLLTAKIVAMVLMGSLALLFGLLPLKVKIMILKGETNSRKRKKRERIISGLLCFGSGVLLATVFVHMIPETREGFQRLQKISSSKDVAPKQHSQDNHSHSFLESPSNNLINKEHGTHNHNHDHHEGEDGVNHDESNHNPSHDHDNHVHQNESHNHFDENHADHHHPHEHENMHHNDTTKTNSSQDHHDISNNKNHDHDHSLDENHSHNHDHDDHVGEGDRSKSLDDPNIDHDHGHNHNHDEHGIEVEGNQNPENNSSSAHDQNHETPQNDTSHNRQTSSRSNGLNNSEVNEIFDEPKNQSINEQTTLKSALEDINSTVNSEHDKMHNNSEPDHKDSAILNKNDNLNIENDHDKIPSVSSNQNQSSEISSTGHNESKSDDDHSDHDHSHSMEPHSHIDPNNQDTGQLESITEHQHNNDIDINNENNNENAPKFEALTQEGNESNHLSINNSQTSGESQNNDIRNNNEDKDHTLHGHEDHGHQDQDHHTQHGHEDEHDHSEDAHGYPMAELVICLGFLTIYLIEEIVHKLLLKHSHHHHHHHHHPSIRHHHHHHHHSTPEDENSIEVGSVQTNISSLPGLDNGSVKDKETNINGLSINANNNHKWNEKANRATRLPSQGIDNPAFAGDIEATSWSPGLRNSIMMESSNQVVPTSITNGNGVIGNGAPVPVPLSDTVPQEKPKPPKKGIGEHILSNIRSLLVVIALSFHSIFEGLAVGLQEVQKDVWYLFLAISAHKFVIAFCIGLEFLEAGTPLVLYLLYMVGLALITPLGVGIGIIITENQSFGGIEHYYVITVLQGLAGGTLLYVALLEVLERERNKPGGRFIKLICLALGFGAMASLEAIGGGHSHGPSEGGH